MKRDRDKYFTQKLEIFALKVKRRRRTVYFLNKYANLMNGDEGKVIFAHVQNMEHFKTNLNFM